MRQVFSAADYCPALLAEEKIPVRRGLTIMAILLLGLMMPLHAQTAEASSSDLQLPAADANRPRQYETDTRGLLSSMPARSTIALPIAIPAGASQEKDLGSSAISALMNFDQACAKTNCSAWFEEQQPTLPPSPPAAKQPQAEAGTSTESSKDSGAPADYRERRDFNRDIYYRNRLEFGLDVGWHPVNIPFIYDFAVGDSYNMTPLKYTLVPIIASLRWHVTNVGWRWIFRGNMDFTFSGSITAIPRGPETHYYAFNFGIRRNFVYRNWRAVPFFEQRGGAGMIDAKEPLGVLFAQGQNLTFTYSLGVGVRYNFDSKYSLSAGMNYMHISNGYLSQPQFENYGINVYGPMFGFNMRLGKPRHHASE